MINKQGLWFITLFSLILVLSIYYITMPDEMFLTNNNTSLKSDEVNLEVENQSYIAALSIELEDEREKIISTFEEVINNKESTAEEINIAYENIKNINNIKAKEEDLENKIKKNLELESFIKIDNKDISVIASGGKHDVALANKIMKLVKEDFKENVSISVKFKN